MKDKVAFGAILAAGVVLPGVANYFLSQAGFGTVGSLVWAMGYLTAVLVIWYIWIRPLDLTGPIGEGR